MVVEVATDTANMLNETVLYAIIGEDSADRMQLLTAHDAFVPSIHTAEHLERQQDAEDAVTTAATQLT